MVRLEPDKANEITSYCIYRTHLVWELLRASLAKHCEIKLGEIRLSLRLYKVNRYLFSVCFKGFGTVWALNSYRINLLNLRKKTSLTFFQEIRFQHENIFAILKD